VEWREEENLFFKLSSYSDRLLEWYRSNPGCIRPESRRNEVIRFVEGGLRDLSISRVNLKWGIPFPDRPGHVVYVWLDALTNYISALGYGGDEESSRYNELWPASLHLVGKDILRFHCVYWPAFLMSAGLPLPQCIFGHGWWMADDKKMSKSLGNVVRPDYLIDRFGPDALRYFLVREMAFGQDSSFSDRAFLERLNSDLANALGNAASRTLALTRQNLQGRTPAVPADSPLAEASIVAVTDWRRHMEALEPQRAVEAIWSLLAQLDGFIQDRQPWRLAKDPAARPELEATLGACLETLRLVSLMIEPVMPTTARSLRDQLGAAALPTDLATGAVWGLLPAGSELGESRPLFPRVDIDKTMQELAMREESTPTDTPAAATEPADDRITIDDFAKVQLKVGVVREAEAVPKSKKLIRLQVDLGEAELRQIVAGIAERYEPESLVGRQVVVVANLKPAKLMGVESRGMLLAASVDGTPYVLSPDGEVEPGTGVR
jgi:methionyl-tRNA synthetase